MTGLHGSTTPMNNKVQQNHSSTQISCLGEAENADQLVMKILLLGISVSYGNMTKDLMKDAHITHHLRTDDWQKKVMSQQSSNSHIITVIKHFFSYVFKGCRPVVFLLKILTSL